jgi:hypothetical protein
MTGASEWHGCGLVFLFWLLTGSGNERDPLGRSMRSLRLDLKQVAICDRMWPMAYVQAHARSENLPTRRDSLVRPALARSTGTR